MSDVRSVDRPPVLSGENDTLLSRVPMVRYVGRKGFEGRSVKVVLKTLFWAGLLQLAVAGHGAWAQNDAVSAEEKNAFTTVEWADLIPPEVLEILLNPPSYIADIEDGSAEDQITSQMKNTLAEEEEDISVSN